MPVTPGYMKLVGPPGNQGLEVVAGRHGRVGMLWRSRNALPSFTRLFSLLLHPDPSVRADIIVFFL